MTSSAVVVGAGVLGSSVADRLARSGWAVRTSSSSRPGTCGPGAGDESRLIRAVARRRRDAHADVAARAGAVARARPARWSRPRAWRGSRGATDGWEADSERVADARWGSRTSGSTRATCSRASGPTTSRSRCWSPRPGSCTRASACGRWPTARSRRAPSASVAVARPDGRARRARRRARAGGRRRRLGLRRLDARRCSATCWTCASPSRTSSTSPRRGAWATPGVPGWVDYDGAAYGLGDLDGRGVKVAPDVDGPPFDAQTGERRVAPGARARSPASTSRHRFPALAGAPLVGARICQYEITPDTWFVAAPHPGARRPRLAARRRLRPRVQARPGAGERMERVDHRRRAGRAALRARRRARATRRCARSASCTRRRERSSSRMFVVRTMASGRSLDRPMETSEGRGTDAPGTDAAAFPGHERHALAGPCAPPGRRSREPSASL